jgi:hypothetical protein
MGEKTRQRVGLAVVLLLTIACPAIAQQSTDVDTILQGAESLFKAMKQRDYPGIWTCISARSRATIVETTAKGVAKSYSREQVETDFTIGRLIAKSYWDEYLRYFDPDAVLEQSKWEIPRAATSGNHPAAPADQLRDFVFNEGGQWKVGSRVVRHRAARKPIRSIREESHLIRPRRYLSMVSL